MTRDSGVVVERLDGSGAAAAEDAFRLVYAEVFAEPPHSETEDDVEIAFRRFPAQIRRDSFRATLARTGAGEPVGIAYGHAVPADTEWWDRLTEPVTDAMRYEDGRRTFGLMELAVRAPWRGRGIARRLHTALLDGVRAQRVLLNVHTESEAASAAYRAWGYRRIGGTRPWPGADVYDLMVLELPGTG
ncbi:GNAT family N-acetyltransferase [Streptomyces sp. NPDC000594]|uniref:GNAT family N-acetyltransferase n=1 Tax=Streptomyces sp. NPDC000594 TaxID=3154261 RepID=UPI00331C569A